MQNLPTNLRIRFFLYKSGLYSLIFIPISGFAFIIGKHIESIFLFVAYLIIRYKFPKTYHDENAYICVTWSIVAFIISFSVEMIEHKAKEMGIEFGKDFTFAEFYTTALMLYTDFRKVLGGGNIDLYVRLAQAWLMDDDINLDAGEKLCVYYDRIVNG